MAIAQEATRQRRMAKVHTPDFTRNASRLIDHPSRLIDHPILAASAAQTSHGHAAGEFSAGFEPHAAHDAAASPAPTPPNTSSEPPPHDALTQCLRARVAQVVDLKRHEEIAADLNARVALAPERPIDHAFGDVTQGKLGLMAQHAFAVAGNVFAFIVRPDNHHVMQELFSDNASFPTFKKQYLDNAFPMMVAKKVALITTNLTLDDKKSMILGTSLIEMEKLYKEQTAAFGRVRVPSITSAVVYVDTITLQVSASQSLTQ